MNYLYTQDVMSTLKIIIKKNTETHYLQDKVVDTIKCY